jgi:type II secretory pathway pseudopilin PulG
MTMIINRDAARPRLRAGITLTEILISIMILGIGLVSLATLFPIGLIRLREAQRQTRSAYLTESAQSEVAARGLFDKSSFLNVLSSPWYVSNTFVTPTQSGLYPHIFSYDPFIQDTPAVYADWSGGATLTTPGAFANLGVYRGYGGIGPNGPNQVSLNRGIVPATPLPGSGLPIAYDPLWRLQTGTYLNPNLALPFSFEARFGSGIGFLRNDPFDNGPPSAHGLQRLTNFNVPLYGLGYAASIQQAFVSPEDMVWQEPTNTTPADVLNGVVVPYTLAFDQQDSVTAALGSNQLTNPSPLVPDLNIDKFTDPVTNKTKRTYNWIVDFRYTWLFTGQQSDTSHGDTFDGNIVIMENRPFSIDAVEVTPRTLLNRVAGEIVVEAIFGYNSNVVQTGQLNGTPVGYGVASNRAVMLRWPATQPDPEVKVGSWIADVTYERHLETAWTRFRSVPSVRGTIDDLPAQRCFWYQVSKVTPPADATGTLAFAGDPGPYRYMMIWTGTDLRAKTVLNVSNAQPAVLNAALVSPYVVNVFPRTFLLTK